MRQNVRVETLARKGQNVNRQLLENALAQSQGVSQFAMNSDNFGGGRAGAFGAVAQGLTAGIGAYAQYKNQQKLVELNASDAEAFASFATEKGNPELASIASRLSPESREAYYLSMILPQSQNANIPSAIREFEYYKTLPTEQQAQYLGVKRNIAGEGGIVRSTGAIETLGGYGQAGAQKTGMEQTARNVSDLSYKPSIAGQSTFAQGKAEEDVKAQEKLNKVNADSSNLISLLDTLTTHPGVPDLFGAKGGGAILSYVGKNEPIAGSNAAGAKALFDQVRGQQFLQAFENLKGGGQISEKEGEAATKALSALNENISEKELIKNIGILKSTIEKAKYRAEVRASQGYQRQSSQPQQNIEKSVLLPPANTPAKSNIKFLGFE
jgi:hypothetical protein